MSTITKRSFSVFLSASIICVSAFWISEASADSWCAQPIWAHEWGVQAFSGKGKRIKGPSLPGYFHQKGPGNIKQIKSGVWNLPADSGTRLLPVLHFYSPPRAANFKTPLAIEVGFTQGSASHWFPQVDHLRTSSEANSSKAKSARAKLMKLRKTFGPFSGNRPVSLSDPTSQLIWSNLTLSSTPANKKSSSKVQWVSDLRGFSQALWVNNESESERFVFYEADTREQVALSIKRGKQFSKSRRHYVLQNTGNHPIHDVFVIHREKNNVFVYYAPGIPAKATNGFILDSHKTTAKQFKSATRDRLKGLLVDSKQPNPPQAYNWNQNSCVMGRDPAIPETTTEGHRLYSHEVDAILDIWSSQFFEKQGTTILYRENGAYLDEVMPLSIYTDMFHFIKIRRTGLALWQNVSLP